MQNTKPTFFFFAVCFLGLKTYQELHSLFSVTVSVSTVVPQFSCHTSPRQAKIFTEVEVSSYVISNTLTGSELLVHGWISSFYLFFWWVHHVMGKITSERKANESPVWGADPAADAQPFFKHDKRVSKLILVVVKRGPPQPQGCLIRRVGMRH